MVVDFHHHLVPEELARSKGLYSSEVTFLKEGGVPRITMHSKLCDVQVQLNDMDQAGIETSVLSCHLGWDGSLEDCRFINDSFADLQRKFPGRLVGLAHTPVLEGKSALRELERAIKDLGLAGVTIASQIGGLALDAPELHDFYRKVNELNIPIFVHPALVPRGYACLMDYDLPRILGREIDLTVATTRLIAGKILETYPMLKFVISHLGGGIAAVKDRLTAMSYRFGTIERPFEDYLDMLYFDLAGFEGGLTALDCALRGLRADRLVFGTDYPQNFTGVSTSTGKDIHSIRDYIEAVRSLELNDEIKEGILRATATELLKLPRKPLSGVR